MDGLMWYKSTMFKYRCRVKTEFTELLFQISAVFVILVKIFVFLEFKLKVFQRTHCLEVNR